MRSLFLVLISFSLLSSHQAFSDSIGSHSDAEYDQRPAYHITPEKGHWMNDPNGPMLFNGYYHLFFQYNPYDSVWGNMSWAHVVSKDLVHWSREPVALYNDESYDINGVFSGSAAVGASISSGDGTEQPYLFYTCVDADDVELQCLAERNPESSTFNTTLSDWRKSAANPIITAQPSDNWDALNFRDPTLWEVTNTNANTILNASSTWNMIAAASRDEQGVVALYTASSDTFPFGWSYSPVDGGNAFWESAAEIAGYHTWMVECPDFFPTIPSAAFEPNTDELYVLKYSIMETRQELYEVGSYVSDASGSKFVRDLSYFDAFKTPVRSTDSSNSISHINGRDGEDGQFPALLLDYGPQNTFYASKTFLDTANSERLLWGWSPEQDSVEYTAARDWQGVQSLPRSVTVDPTAKILRTLPASAVEELRSDILLDWNKHSSEEAYVQITSHSDDSRLQLHVLPATGMQVEIIAQFTVVSSIGSAGGSSQQSVADCSAVEDLVGLEFGIAARLSDDHSTFTKYGFTIDTAVTNGSTATTLVSAILDSSRSGGSTPSQYVKQVIPGQGRDRSMFFRSSNADIEIDTTTSTTTPIFEMRLYLDHSMSEVFLQEGAVAATMRIYPSPHSQGIAWYQTDGSSAKCRAELAAITIHSMQSIWVETIQQ